MAETLTLDGSPEAVAAGRVSLDLTPFVAQDGPDFGDGALENYYAEAQVGQSVIDFRMPNRMVTIPLVVHGRTGGLTFDELRTALQQKAGLFQREGGVLTRETAIGTVYADIISATLKLGGSSLQAWGFVDADAVLTLECSPDWYGAEVELDDMVETTEGEIVGVLPQAASDAVLAGDHPGRLRIVVDNDSTADQRGLLWAIRSRYYDPAATAALVYEAEDLTPLGGASIVTLTGASGGGSNNAVRRSSLIDEWTAVLSTEIDGVGHMTHAGTYIVWARVHSASSTPPRMRLLWGPVGLSSPVTNRSATLPAQNSAFHWVNLGEVRVESGTGRWQGQIQARDAGAGSNFSIDKLYLLPIDDGYGVLRVVASSGADVLSAFDSFTGTSSGGALDGRTPTVGAAWDTTGGTTDFAFADEDLNGWDGEVVQRSANNSQRRYALFGPTLTDQFVRADVGMGSGTGTGKRLSVVARGTDANNHIRVDVWRVGASVIQADIIKVVSGTPTTLASGTAGGGTTLTRARLEIDVRASGAVTARYTPLNASAIPTNTIEISASDSALATGGALEDGQGGIADISDATFARTYDNITVTEPAAADAVAFASRSVELRTNGIVREDADGGDYAPVAFVVGDLPRLPPSGLEERPVELFVKMSRGDLETMPDSGIDNVSVQAFYRPSWLFVPDGSGGS